uniref:HIT domain-containing protein n=1 Tax=Ningiella ruwaisensis TaxID=2364274 RepID=UPI001F4F654C|nr:HIT domain-containing protein [Ningiella ruwaisensis]
MPKRKMDKDFKLAPQLEKDSIFVCALSLSQVRLINDANYPWYLLVPQINGLKEMHDLSEDLQQMLTIESRRLSQSMATIYQYDKLNVAAIGNVVSQLHVHHIARFTSDIAWPSPVWGYAKAKTYDEQSLNQKIEKMRSVLAGFSL